MGWSIRLTQSEPELEAWFNLLLVKSAVVDEEVPGIVVSAYDVCAVVTSFFGDCIWELSAGRSNTVEDIGKTVSRLLTYYQLAGIKRS